MQAAAIVRLWHIIVTASSIKFSHRIGHLAGNPTQTRHWPCDAHRVFVELVKFFFGKFFTMVRFGNVDRQDKEFINVTVWP